MSGKWLIRHLQRARLLKPQTLVFTKNCVGHDVSLPKANLSMNTRKFYTTESLRANQDQVHLLLQSHSLKVPSFGGSLWVNSSFNVAVKPIGTLDHPNMDKAFVKVYGPSKSIGDLIDITVKQEGHKLSVTGGTTDDSVAEQITVEIEVPIVHNINLITTGQGNISCKDMVESNFCHLTSESGSINVSRLKTANLIIQSESGTVVCKGAIQGSVSIVTGGGDVLADKRFIGPTLDITTDQGNIMIASCYSDQSKFSTMSGNMTLKNLHNESYVAVYEKGKVSMQGVDGCTNVFMKTGDLDIQISHVSNESRLHVEEGDINLKIADNQPVKVCVTGTVVETDEKIAQFGAVETKEDNYQHYLGTIMPDQFSPTCQVVAEKGKVLVACQDWATSMGFKLPGGMSLPPDLDLGKERSAHK